MIKVRAISAKAAEILIYDVIGTDWFGEGVNAKKIKAALDEIGAVGDITVRINSPGGDVFDGLAIYNALRTHTAHITTRVDGLAASVASVIAQAGDTRLIVQSAQMMIHEAWGYAAGPAAELRDFADLLERQTANIAAIYAERGTDDVDGFLERMAAETWLSDVEAVELGLADEVLVPERKDPANAGPGGRPVGQLDPPAPPADPDPCTFDGAGLLARSKVREMFGSTALAD